MAAPLKENASNQKVLIFAGEASGDAYGALVIDNLRKEIPSIDVHGGGGNAMINSGLKPIYTIENLSVIGLVEVLSVIPTLLKIKKRVIKWAEENKPACAIFIDYPGFHVPLAKKIKKLGIPVLYYISPKIWAYREKRIKKVINGINQLASIFDFEKDIYARYDFNNVEFVGHPIVDVLNNAQALDVKACDNLIGLLPGSRGSEITRLLPEMIGAAKLLKSKHPELQFWLSCVDNFDDQYYKDFIGDFSIEFKRDNLHKNIAKTTAIMGASGTVNLEMAYLKVPSVITYRLAPLTHAIAVRFIKIKYASPVNIIMQGETYRELLQDLCTPQNLCDEIESIVFDKQKRQKQKENLALFKQKLGEAGANKRVAKMAIKLGSLK